MIDLRKPDFKAAIFDLDGTLLDSMSFWNRIDKIFLAKRGIHEVPEDYLLAIAHLGAEETAQYTIGRFGLTETPEEMMGEWHDEAVRFYTNDVRLKDGALEYLEYLHTHGVKLAIATASEDALFMPAVKRLGLDRFFSAYARVSEVPRKKDFPDVYELACQRLGTDKADTVVFEDIYTAVCGAKSGGFRTVAVYDETSLRDIDNIRRTADVFIYSFRDALQISTDDALRA